MGILTLSFLLNKAHQKLKFDFRNSEVLFIDIYHFEMNIEICSACRSEHTKIENKSKNKLDIGMLEKNYDT